MEAPLSLRALVWVHVLLSVMRNLSLPQELDDIRKSGIKVFKNVEVDESNILSWRGLIVPVSYRWACYPRFGEGGGSLSWIITHLRDQIFDLLL